MQRAARKTVEHAAERAIGNVLTAVLLVAVVVQLVRGESATPYAQLLLVAGVVWAAVLGLGLLRLRREGAQPPRARRPAWRPPANPAPESGRVAGARAGRRAARRPSGRCSPGRCRAPGGRAARSRSGGPWR